MIASIRTKQADKKIVTTEKTNSITRLLPSGGDNLEFLLKTWIIGIEYRVQSNMKELKLQKLNYLKYRADGLYDSQNEKNNSS
jgi:hypothetical protein